MICSRLPRTVAAFQSVQKFLSRAISHSSASSDRAFSIKAAEVSAAKAINSVLSNGLKVITEPVRGHFSAVGTYIDAGSRYETSRTSGISHIMDRLAFKSTQHRSSDEMLMALERLGGNYMCSSSRETMVYQAAVFNNDVDKMTELIADTIRYPIISQQEIDDTKMSAAYEISEIWSRPEHILPELAHVAAFRNNTLGNPLICPEDNLYNIDANSIQEYRQLYYRPDRMVVAFSGVPHQEALDLAEKYYGDLKKPETLFDPSKKPKAHYTGGLIEIPPEQVPPPAVPNQPALTHLIVAFESIPIDDPDVYAAATLQFLLGGGGSFSAGGPGKGMYSRLYTHVLNQYGFMESCLAFNHSYSDSGLFGISASCDDHAARHLALVVCQEFARLMSPSHRMPITKTEAARAKNLLKASLMYNLESRFILLEDLGRQVQTGHHVSAQEMCERIDAITVGDLYRVASRIFQGNVRSNGLGTGRPTVVVQGNIKEVGDVFKVCDSFGLGS